MNASGLTAVLFDIGNVLIEWDPRHLYRKIFICPDGTPDRARIEWFLSEVCSQARNEEQDRGRTLAAATASLTARWPNYAGEIAAFYDRFQEMIPGAIAESRQVFDHFKDRGLPVYGLTNFSRETFAATRARFDVLRRFDGVLVSGEEVLIKPDGTVSQAKVLESMPPRMFDQAALVAIQRWKFRPKIVDGTPVSQRARQTIQFSLEK